MSDVTVHFKDLGYVVIGTPGEYEASFRIYEVNAWELDGTPLYGHSYIKDINDTAVEVYAHGYVKWDGCSNWDIDELYRGMLHGCSRRDLLNLGRILGECWDMASDLCLSWNDDVADPSE